MTRRIARIAGKLMIVAFVTWHMFAVAAYALPGAANDAITPKLRELLFPKVSPYILTTSQWQQWNLFSPDPLRRVSRYIVEVQDRRSWKPVLDLHPGSYPWWRHAAQFKLFGSIFEDTPHTDPIVERYLQMQCRDLALPAGMPIRLVLSYYVIPAQDRTPSVDWWWHYAPEETRADIRVTACAPGSLDPQ